MDRSLDSKVNVTLKASLRGLILYSGLLALWQHLANRNRPLILSYHEISDVTDDVTWCSIPDLVVPASLFEAHVSYVSRTHRIVSLDEVVKSPSGRVAAITFDDGFRGTYLSAYPVLKSLGISATVFLATDYLGKADLPWWENTIRRIWQVLSYPDEHRRVLCAGLQPRWRASLMKNTSALKVFAEYKSSPLEERRGLEEFLAAVTDKPAWRRRRLFLSNDEVREMSAAGVSFGAHSKSHRILPWLDEQSMLEELKESKAVVQRLTGAAKCWFAYPDGAFTEREERAVRELGFAGAVQTSKRPERKGPFALSRVDLVRSNTTGLGGSFSRVRTEFAIRDFNKSRLRAMLKGKTSALCEVT